MLLVVGRILRPHGIHGEVMVEIRTDDPGERFAPGRVLATRPGALGPVTVASARPHAGRLLVCFSGVSERDAAERFSGALLVIDSADVPPPDDPDEFHDSQLIGLDVVTVTGRHVGTVADVLHHGQDLLVIQRDGPEADNPMDPERLPLGGTAGPGDTPRNPRMRRERRPAQAVKDQQAEAPTAGTAELLVPFVAAIVAEVDLPSGRLLIDPPPGLLDDQEPA